MTSERLDELIQKYVLGIQTGSETDELAQHLMQDEAEDARRALRLALKTDAHLEEAAAEMGSEAGSQQDRPITQGPSLYRSLWTLGGIAAAIAAGVFGWLHNPEETQIESEFGVASILRIEGEGLANGKRSLSVGDPLLAGDQLTLSEGLIELVFRNSGVHAIATAPLSLTTKSPQRIFLHNGDIKLHVPPQGIGFVVETAEREITDLGTSFVVTARPKGSQVFVLDGQIAIGQKNGVPGRLMTEGEIASFNQKGELKLLSKKTAGLPELSQSTMKLNPSSLEGVILGFKNSPDFPNKKPRGDLLGHQLAPLILSGFQDRSCLDELKRGQALSFTGIAGSYNQFTERQGLEPYAAQAGWLSWHHGKVTPPSAGRYRFWGYADNNLLVAVNGKPVFDGSRYDSALHSISKVTRQNHPAWPCLNARAGFATGPWIELGDDPVQLDILFGEVSGNLTSGLLLIEREGENYEETFWGQPMWPLFLTEEPDQTHREELDRLRIHMEKKLMGSFSINNEAVWKVR